jgi:ferrous iron transport protein B
LFAAIFFPEHAGLVIFSMYLLGIVTAIVVGLILRSTLLRAREPSAFLMELPPYRVPSLAGIWCSIRTRTGAFVRNAWTIILAVSVVLWFLLAIPVRGEGGFADTEIDDSLFAAVSSTAAPALEPLGFGTWEASGALLTGFVAKEVVIATMAQIYHVDDAPVVAEPEPTSFLADVGGIVTSFGAATVDTLKSIPLIVGIDLFADEAEPEPTTLMNAVQRNFAASSGGHGMLAGLAFMVFILLYTPCMAAVAAEKQELGTKWTWFSIVGQLLLAWLMAFLIFQGGKLLGLG